VPLTRTDSIMKLTLLWPASSSDRDFAEPIGRYVKRIRHFFPIEVVEVAAARGRQSQSDLAIMRSQSARLGAAIPSRGHTVVLDERGQNLDSLKFARWLERLTIDSPHGVNFVVGGDVGIDDTVRQRADTLLSLSAMTLPHQLARLVLLEQIYRACTLMRNIPYHK
jgi:23S rRNA (pseudouridine1915-N3)-methyltransferase